MPLAISPSHLMKELRMRSESVGEVVVYVRSGRVSLGIGLVLKAGLDNIDFVRWYSCRQ